MNEIFVGSKIIGNKQPVYIIAEMSANHCGDINKALEIVREAAKAGADCVKIQTYTADTITIDCDNPEFILHGGLWDGYKLYDLYKEAYTPWEWQQTIMEECEKCGVDFLSTPFDKSAVDFLETMGVGAYKIASYEFNDIDLIEYTASKGKPMIMSCGMANHSEIGEAIEACRRVGNENIIILKCTSEYPAKMEDMNIAMMPKIADEFGVLVGLSDHSAGSQVAEIAVAMGAKVVEKHVIMHRSDGGPDAGFSMEMSEFAEMVKRIRQTEQIMGDGEYKMLDSEAQSRGMRRSLYFVNNIKNGEIITEKDVRSIRPANGISTKYLKDIIGKKATRDISFGEPVAWDKVE